MTQRTIRSTVTFSHPFSLSGFTEPQPAGTYTIETHEDLVEGLSFPVYRRTETLLFLHPPPEQPNLVQIATIDPVELEQARRRDEAGNDHGTR
ncbi:MAG TPA: hypothetical protein VK943_19850 [Arenibaculum sp.]|nr:hypothetical protein [Arenibaculum sp.]